MAYLKIDIFIVVSRATEEELRLWKAELGTDVDASEWYHVEVASNHGMLNEDNIN